MVERRQASERHADSGDTVEADTPAASISELDNVKVRLHLKPPIALIARVIRTVPSAKRTVEVLYSGHWP